MSDEERAALCLIYCNDRPTILNSSKTIDRIWAALAAVRAEAALAKREACAKVADGSTPTRSDISIAAAIRARK